MQRVKSFYLHFQRGKGQIIKNQKGPENSIIKSRLAGTGLFLWPVELECGFPPKSLLNSCSVGRQRACVDGAAWPRHTCVLSIFLETLRLSLGPTSTLDNNSLIRDSEKGALQTRMCGHRGHYWGSVYLLRLGSWGNGIIWECWWLSVVGAYWLHPSLRHIQCCQPQMTAKPNSTLHNSSWLNLKYTYFYLLLWRQLLSVHKPTDTLSQDCNRERGKISSIYWDIKQGCKHTGNMTNELGGGLMFITVNCLACSFQFSGGFSIK